MNAETPAPVPTVPAVPAPQELLAIAVAAAHEAAEYIRSLDRDHLAREYKTSSHDIVTEHDKRSEEIIVASLRTALPGCRIVGEEGGERAAAQAGPEQVSFYVDPIDGTSNFAAGLPLFCVSIGVAVGAGEQERLVAGVIDVPILEQVFTAADGPAALNGREITPRATHAAADALLVTGFPSQRIIEEEPEVAARAATDLHVGVSAVRHLGSAAIELAYVAAGWADATGLGSINAWDVAAGFHILERAGGSLRTWPALGDARLPAHHQPAYVACTGQERIEVFDRLQDELQAAREARAAGAASAHV